MSDLHDKLFQEDLIHLLKELIEAQKNQPDVIVPEIKVPEVNVPKIDTPEVNIDIKAFSDELRAILSDLKPKSEVKVTNIKEIKQDSISIKNLKTIESLLQKLLKKDTHITLKQDKQKIEVKMPTLSSPKDYVPVRLTDGLKFYNAIAHAVSSAGISKDAQDNLEKLRFEGDKLKVDAEFTGDIVVDTSNLATEETLQKTLIDESILDTEYTDGKLTKLIYADREVVLSYTEEGKFKSKIVNYN